MKEFFRKVDRLFTAISYAEAGDLDAVQKILDENKLERESRKIRKSDGMANGISFPEFMQTAQQEAR
ncbi:MAG: hypothetical protein ACYC05_09385 [Sulfuricella sp.]